MEHGVIGQRREQPPIVVKRLGVVLGLHARAALVEQRLHRLEHDLELRRVILEDLDVHEFRAVAELRRSHRERPHARLEILDLEVAIALGLLGLRPGAGLGEHRRDHGVAQPLTLGVDDLAFHLAVALVLLRPSRERHGNDREQHEPPCSR